MVTCDVCGKEFKKRRHLRLHHRRNHVDKSEWSASCEICGKVYADEEILKRHMVNHEKTKTKVQCPVSSCKKSFFRTNFLYKHIASHHPEVSLPETKDHHQPLSVKKEYCCGELNCNASFSKHHLLTQHSYIHTSIPPFACSHCDKRFMTLNHKKRHEKVHEGYPCDVCSTVLPTWSSFLSHKAKDHPVEHKCSECGKVFMSRCRLKDHMSVHAEVRPVFQCSQCDRNFTRKHGLNKHISVVHEGIKPFKCHIEGCEKSYAYCHSLKKHLDVFHQPNRVVKKQTRRKMSTASRVLGVNTRAIGLALSAAQA